MDSEKLNVSIIYGTGNSVSALPELLNNLPQVNIAEQSVDVAEFLNRTGAVSPDTLVVYLDGMTTPPEWIGDLSRKYPRTPVLVCSERTEAEFLLRAMQLGVREFLPLPLSQTEVQDAIDRVWSTRQLLSGDEQSIVVAVAGHKGGVGATTIAINLAVALAELRTERCALVDLGRPFPDIGNFLDQVPTFDLGNVIHNPGTLDQSFFTKIMQPYGNHLAILHGISDFKEQDNLNLDCIDKVFDILRSLYRIIVVDLGHLFDEMFSLVFREADLVLMLTELDVPNFRNLRRLWPILKDWEPSGHKIKLVVNRQNRNADLSVWDLEEILNESPIVVLPSDYRPLIEAINQGVPLADVAPRCKLYQGLKNLAQKIVHAHFGDEPKANGAQLRRRFWIF